MWNSKKAVMVMARAMPQSSAVRSSFQITLPISENRSSSRLKARITVTED